MQGTSKMLVEWTNCVFSLHVFVSACEDEKTQNTPCGIGLNSEDCLSNCNPNNLQVPLLNIIKLASENTPTTSQQYVHCTLKLRVLIALTIHGTFETPLGVLDISKESD